MKKTKQQKQRLLLKISSTIITILAVLLILYTLLNQDQLQAQFSSQVQTYGIPSLFILAFILDLIPQLISPIMPLAAALTTSINPHYAIFSTALGSTLGSILGYIIGKHHMYQAVRLTTEQKTRKKMTHLVNKYGKIIIPLAAISPLPYLPILLGAMNLSKKNFLIYGLIPRVLSFAIYGYLVHLI